MVSTGAAGAVTWPGPGGHGTGPQDRPNPLSPPAVARRGALGDEVFVAVPACQAADAAHLLALGARVHSQRTGQGVGAALHTLLLELRAVGDEHRARTSARSAGSQPRTDPAPLVDVDALSGHDLLIAEAAQLTGWSRSYLARLARAGRLGARRRDGVWQLDRVAVLAELARRGLDAG